MKLYKLLFIIPPVLLLGIWLGSFFDDTIYVDKVEYREIPDFAFTLYELANNERINKMDWDPCLAKKAEERAVYIVENHLFSHSDLTGKKPYMQMISSCLDYVDAGENLAENYSDPQSAHTGFMNSPTHRANIMDQQYGQMGVGCYKNTCVEFFSN